MNRAQCVRACVCVCASVQLLLCASVCHNVCRLLKVECRKLRGGGVKIKTAGNVAVAHREIGSQKTEIHRTENWLSCEDCVT